jgi:hypothetical protein
MCVRMYAILCNTEDLFSRYSGHSCNNLLLIGYCLFEVHWFLVLRSSNSRFISTVRIILADYRIPIETPFITYCYADIIM